MDNLKERRLLAIAGIGIITAGIIALFYGLFTGQIVLQLLGLAAIVVAYFISRRVSKLRKVDQEQRPK
ncbi:MAG: hypothetical protein A4E28_02863 [Methanocella sp. PtaU1.Bin125]|nr:MAG: hypothetical protein A4E28_02863 [Methanocella sp. PtaU1.Bin125]